jgi:hypothetical protein
MPRIEGYVGICGVCFEPIATGDEMQFRKNGKYFHKKCAENPRNHWSYYMALERIRADFENGANPTVLMDEMEDIFKVPALNDPVFNEDNPEVIKLFREIGNSRIFD